MKKNLLYKEIEQMLQTIFSDPNIIETWLSKPLLMNLKTYLEVNQIYDIELHRYMVKMIIFRSV